MFCFNEFAFTVQVKHKINSTQILGFILICLYFTTDHFHTCVLCKECSRYLPFFNSWLSFQRLCRLLWGYTPASSHASSIPEFSIDVPSALNAAITVCSSPRLGKTVLFRSSLASTNCTAFSYKAMSKVITVGCSSPVTKL